jgi:TolA-binding protein
MKRLPPEPIRILDLPAQDVPANAARLVRSAIRSSALPVPRLKGRIRYTLRRKSAWRLRYLRVALVGGVIFLTGGVLGAVVQPLLNLWRQRQVESVENVYPSPAAPRSHHRRGSAPSPRMIDEGLLSPEKPADPPSLPPVLAPTPSSQPAPPTPVRAESASARTKPSAARTPVLPTTAPRVPSSTGQEARPTPARHSTRSDPWRTAMLEPPPRQSEPWPTSPPVAPPMPAAAPPAYGSAAPPEAQAVFQPTVAGSIRPPSAPPAVAPKPTVPPPPSEQALLSRAVRNLRSEHRPESALAVLDEYVARFPRGSLFPEATRLRAEALLALGHKPAALAELNRVPVPGAAGGEESRLVRGELHAAAGRWREALADFDAVVRARIAHESTADSSTSTKLRERFERALWGRASARSQLGDDAGARTDLNECLRRFPQGRFATQAAHLLGELR